MGVTLASWFVPEGLEALPFLALGSLAAMFMGAAKSGFAGGAGLLSVPLLIYACGGNSELAIGMMLPLLIACDYVTLVIWWRKWDFKNVLLLLPGMLVGISLGSVVLWYFLRLGQGQRAAGQEVTNAALSFSIGMLAVGFVVLQAIRMLRGELRPFRPVFWHGFLAGSSAGLTSTLAHSAGPITTMYLVTQKMPKGRFVATAVLYYWIGNQAKLIPYAILGILTRSSLAGDLALLPAIVIGALLGVFLHRRVNERVFSAIVHGLLAIIGVKLVVESAARLGG